MTLRLHIEPPQDPLAPLEFPRRALDEARCFVKRAANENGGMTRRIGTLANRIEAELDRMQANLDQLKDDVEHYRFPIFSEYEPSPAA